MEFRSNVPEFIIESSKFGQGGRFRFGMNAENVRHSVRGLLIRYPNAEVKVRAIIGLHDVTSEFILGEHE